MTAPAARVAALIDRAVHVDTPTEEARTAALIACRLIRKHGLAVGQVARQPTYTVSPFAAQYTAWRHAPHDAWVESRDPAGTWADDLRWPEPEEPRPTPDPNASEWPSPPTEPFRTRDWRAPKP